MAGKGRPTKLTPAMLKKASQYIDDYQANGDLVPTVVGLAIELDIDRTTCYAWGKENEEFSHILMRVEAKQERALVNGGLGGAFNPAITKMMLAKHGYSDKPPEGEDKPRESTIHIVRV